MGSMELVSKSDVPSQRGGGASRLDLRKYKAQLEQLMTQSDDERGAIRVTLSKDEKATTIRRSFRKALDELGEFGHKCRFVNTMPAGVPRKGPGGVRNQPAVITVLVVPIVVAEDGTDDETEEDEDEIEEAV